mgnify:CR=1 FL=1
MAIVLRATFIPSFSKNLSLSDINEVDGEDVPIRHFGVILKPLEWEFLKKRIISKKVNFIIKPVTRFKNKTGEQSTMFIQDPSGNALEFKSFANDNMISKKISLLTYFLILPLILQYMFVAVSNLQM